MMLRHSSNPARVSCYSPFSERDACIFCKTKKKMKRNGSSNLNPWDPKDMFFSDAEEYQLN
jgi:hypothetical protein